MIERLGKVDVVGLTKSQVALAAVKKSYGNRTITPCIGELDSRFGPK